MRLPALFRSKRRRSSDDRPEPGLPATAKQHKAERYALGAAGVVIVLLTGGAFWLSYAHLAEVAGQHGLGKSPIRQWAWPATLDAFIVAGELLMLHAGLRRVTDWWAIALTATGSVGSIALNVAGVSGTAGANDLLAYLVAAVPPTAALLAFGVLMRQVHQLVDRSSGHPGTVSGKPNDDAVQKLKGDAVQKLKEGAFQKLNASGQEAGRTAASTGSDGPGAVPTAQLPEPPAQVPESKSRGGRPASATIEELVEIARSAAAENGGKLTRDLVRKAVKAKGLTIGSGRLTEVMGILKPEFEADAAASSASG